MGSGSSVGIKCPSGYPKEDFKKLLMLYDKIDKDGDQAANLEEVSKIANLHVNNRILTLKKEIRDLIEQHNYKLKQLNNSIVNLEKLTEDERNKLFCKAVTGKENSKGIEWDDFFKYMKHRTEDIPNIDW